MQEVDEIFQASTYFFGILVSYYIFFNNYVWSTHLEVKQKKLLKNG